MIKRMLLYVAVLATLGAIAWALLRPAPYRSLVPSLRDDHEQVAPWTQDPEGDKTPVFKGHAAERALKTADSLVNAHAARETIE